MTIIGKHEDLLGKRWKEWTKEERMAVACTLEESDIQIPLLVNIVMEAYMGGAEELMRPSTVTMIEGAINSSQKEQQVEVGGAMKIISEEKYRSRPKVNVSPDMVRVTMDMRLREWHRIKKLIVENDAKTK